MSDPGTADVAGLYRETRQRLASLVAGLDAAALGTEAPACPGWAVRDVLAHVVAIAEDTVAGRLAGFPTNEHNAAQVARMSEVAVPELLGRWAAAAPRFEEMVGARAVWPAVIDLASHEQDIRGAIGRPGARDCRAVRHAARLLLSGLAVPVPLRVVTEDGEFLAGPDGARHNGAGPDGAGQDGPGGQARLTLSTTTFEAFRWRMGRRSRAQLAALDWSGDPARVLDHLCVFGPATRDIIE